MNRKAHVVVYTESLEWTSAVQRSFPQDSASVNWVLNHDEVISACQQHSGGSVILETSASNFASTCRLVSELENNPFQYLCFAAGFVPRRHQKLMNLAGFSGWANNHINWPKLVRAIYRHQNSPRCQIKETLEQRIWRSLPWGTAAERLGSLKSGG